MAQTTYGVPYPLPDEPVAEGAARIRDVAEALDSKVLAGRIDWGPAGAPDTTLYRAGVGSLATPGAFNVGGLLIVDGDATGDRLWFGNAFDTSLYRVAANQLKTDGVLHVGAGLVVDENGGGNVIWFGGGYDTSLGRVGAGFLGTNGHLRVGGYLDVDFADAGGKIRFGSAQDTNLYRAGPGSLKTDGELRVGSAIFANVGLPYQTALGGGGNGLASVYFGSNLDTILYRVGVNALKTDGTLDAGAVQIGGSGIGVAGDTSLYRAGAGYWQTEASLILGGKLRYGNWAEAANPTAGLVARVPFYDKNETRTGYLHVYDS